MRIDSAHESMRIDHKGGYIPQKIPRSGTKLRELYELFQMNKGEIIELPLTIMYAPSYIYVLQDFYGLDIRRIGNIGSKGRGRGRPPGKWILAGEWFGRD